MNDTPLGVGTGILLLKDGKILMGHRASAHGNDTWSFPGGRLEVGETFEQCICRETQEETGLIIDPAKIKLVSVSNDIYPDRHSVTFGFMSEDFIGELKVMEPDKHDQWKWFPLEELPKNIFLSSKNLIDNYKKGSIYNP